MAWIKHMKNILGLIENTTIGMKYAYKSKLLPLEKQYNFHEFHSPMLDDGVFEAKPMVLLMGQYSTGKTTFIRHLLKQDFPGMRIGQEPTTDRFIALMHGKQEIIIPGNVLVGDREKQFRQLSKYGNTFLNRFQCSTLDSPVLRTMTMVDTPGILSGEAQRIDRGYDFTGVIQWFAEHVDRIILLFDAHKLDISDDFKKCLEVLKGQDDKIRIVLNKADMVDQQQLMRIYGALMWNLGKIFHTPEVSRVYIGSFWDQPLIYDVNKELLDAEERDLFMELQALPRDATLRKLNDLIKRARLAKAHAYVISELSSKMPLMFGKEKMKMKLIADLQGIYKLVEKKYGISHGDFPDLEKMKHSLQTQDFTKLSKLKPGLLEAVNKMLADDVPKIQRLLWKEKLESESGPLSEGGAFEDVADNNSSFGYGRGTGFDAGSEDSEYICNKNQKVSHENFEKLKPVEGKISGTVAKQEFMKSKLPRPVLRKIWQFSDLDGDGFLDLEEYTLAMHLIDVTRAGYDLPKTLPDHLVPPSKRSYLFLNKSNVSIKQ